MSDIILTAAELKKTVVTMLNLGVQHRNQPSSRFEKVYIIFIKIDV